MRTFTITRDARRIVRELQSVDVEADSEEEALRTARGKSDSEWEEYQFEETWTDSASDYQIASVTCVDCGCSDDDCTCHEPPECSQCCAPLIVPEGQTAYYSAKCVDCADVVSGDTP